MWSSTSFRVSGKAPPSGRARLVAGLIVAPLAWLLSLELGYVSTTERCHGWAMGSPHVWVLAPIAITAATAVWTWRIGWHAREPRREWERWAARASLWMCLWFTLVILATDLPLFVIRPCL